MLISKSDAVALISIASIATITTAVVLPKIEAEVKSAFVKNAIKKSEKPTRKEVNLTKSNNSKEFGVDDLVTGTLLAGAVWAITKNG